MTEDRHTTKDRLLDAAEGLFAEKAFEKVSVRELATAAGVNAAAVNYHFQNKENLYREVILRRFVIQRDTTLAAFDKLMSESHGHPPVDQVIRTFVRMHMEGAMPGHGSAGFMVMMARNMGPGQRHMAGPFFQTIVAPVFGTFSRMLIAARPSLNSEQVTWIAASIVGQIHHLVTRWQKKQDLQADPECYAVMAKAFPPLELSQPEYVKQVTEHITRFSTAAIDGLYPEVTT